MPRRRRFSNTFLGGEVSPQVYERYDFDKRDSSLSALENMIPELQGPARRRNGSRFVNLVKLIDGKVRLLPFVFSRTQAYILELGDQYMRFYRDEGVLIDGGSEVEIATPWTEAQLRAIDRAQDADTMVLVHPDNDPQRLVRNSDILWGVSDLNLRPGPTVSGDYVPSVSEVTLSATSGFGVTATEGLVLATPTFLRSDVGRTLIETGVGATGVATVSSYTSATVVVLDIFSAFSSLTLFDSSGQPTWQLDDSPLANIAIIDQDTGEPDIEGAVGERVTLIAYQPKLEANADLVINGDFTTGPDPFLSPWTDLSGKALGTGTATTGGSETFIDTTHNFVVDFGAQTNHVVEITTSPREAQDTIVGFKSSTGGSNAFDIVDTLVALTVNAGDTYIIRESGFATAGGSGGIEIGAGTRGAGMIQQSITVDQRSVYEYVIKTTEGNVTLQAGLAAEQSDVLSPVTITPGETRATFTTPNVDGTATFSLFLQIRNDQLNTRGTVESISLRQVAVDAWQLQVPLPGTYIRINGGYVQTTTAGAGQEDINAVVVQKLEDLEDAVAGSWTVEEEAFSKVGGQPTAVAFFQSRLWLAALNQVFGSVAQNPSSFAIGPDPVDAVNFAPDATEIDPIHWMIGETVFVIGSRAEEFTVSGTDTNTLRAGDLNLASPTAIGTEPIKPIRVRNSLLVVEAGGKRVFEFAVSNARNERSERDLSILAEHLITLDDKIVETAWANNPRRTLWIVTELGKLLTLTYIREHNIFAWARHSSSDGAFYRSVASIPHPSGNRDQVWLAVRRPSADRDIVEFFDDDGGLYTNDPATVVDSAIRYSGVATTTISGLGHLANASNVWVVDVQGAQGPYSVDGTGVLSGIQHAVTEADIGLFYDANLTTLRPSIDGAGPTGLRLGKTEMYARLFNTGDGVEANGYKLKLRRSSDAMDSRITPYTGEVKIPSNGTDFNSFVTIKQTIPETFEVQSIAGSMEVEDT